MHLSLARSTALIVGCAEGIGRAVAEEFAREGAGLVLVDKNADVARAASELAELYGATTEHATLDAADFSAVRAVVEEADLRTPVDHLVYCVGAGSGALGFPFWNVAPERWPRALAVNLLGAVHFATALGPRMSERGRGTMTFLSSVAGQIGSQTDPPYSAAKAGLINFAMCAARDLAPSGVRVNVVCPGMVDTSLSRAIFAASADAARGVSYDDWSAEKIRRLMPLGKWVRPEDVAAMCAFLASSRAANITGQTLNVDGGYVMHW